MKNENSYSDSNATKAFIFLLGTFLITSLFLRSCSGQTVVKAQGKELVTVHNTVHKDTVVNHSMTANATLTEYTFHDSKGVSYPVWRSSGGAYFVIRTSKKSNQNYKQYLKIESL